MNEPADPATSPADPRQAREDRFAGPMFFLAVLFLVVLAGLIHRYPRLEPDATEAYLIVGGLGVLWVVFLLEAALRYSVRDRARPAWKSLAAAAACGLVPPLRMGCRSQIRSNHIWLPVLGWQKRDGHLRRSLERFFSVPMILFALMVLPLFALEFYWADQVREYPALALALDIGTSVIWLAFAVELVVMAAVADRPVRYCFQHWIDVAIVVLPAFEVLPLFRVLRLGRVLRLDQVLRAGRVYRLRALAMRGWRAVLLLQVVQRLTGRSTEHRLKQLRALLQAKEEEVADLREEIDRLAGHGDRNARGREVEVLSPRQKQPGGEFERMSTPERT
jgi:voltage-gated potassium channel